MPPTKGNSKTVDPSDSDGDLFAEAVGAVTRVDRDNLVAAGRRSPPISAADPHDDAKGEPGDLVSGRTAFEIEHFDEAISGMANGVDRKLLRRLKRGQYSVAAHLDLHGHTRNEARDRVASFVTDSQRKGHRCVLIVHGRGLHSEGNIAVIKEGLTSWLSRGTIARNVLAFCSAQPTDGGLGAVYVLLRRR